MSTTYAQRQTTAQKKDASSASSVLDYSSQSESLQRKADMANNAAQRAEAPRPNNTGMPDNLKSGIESLSGFSMDDVRVHYNSSKPATVQALAYTQGTDIHVAPGQEKHLPHEAWHVAQQMAGRVSPTTSINGLPVNDNAGLEHEADVMGEKAVQCKGMGNVYNALVNKNISQSTVQCEFAHIHLKNSMEVLPATDDDDSSKLPHIAFESLAGGERTGELGGLYNDVIKRYKGRASVYMGVNVCRYEYDKNEKKVLGKNEFAESDLELCVRAVKAEIGAGKEKNHSITIIPFTYDLVGLGECSTSQAPGEGKQKIPDVKNLMDISENWEEQPIPKDLGEKSSSAVMEIKSGKYENAASYTFPFYEARSMIMSEAGKSGAALYRWIDSDVKDDSSIDEINEKGQDVFLNYNSENAHVWSGFYKWRKKKNEKTDLPLFLKILNSVEEKWRTFFWSKYRGGYIPEPIVYMNSKAHSDACTNLGTNIDGNKKQDRESEKAFKNMEHTFVKSFSVTKPRKEYFDGILDSLGKEDLSVKGALKRAHQTALGWEFANSDDRSLGESMREILLTRGEEKYNNNASTVRNAQEAFFITQTLLRAGYNHFDIINVLNAAGFDPLDVVHSFADDVTKNICNNLGAKKENLNGEKIGNLKKVLTDIGFDKGDIVKILRKLECTKKTIVQVFEYDLDVIMKLFGKNVSAEDLKKEKIYLSDMKAVGFTSTDIANLFGKDKDKFEFAKELKDAGFDALCIAKYLKNKDESDEKIAGTLKSIGFNLSDMNAAGFSPMLIADLFGKNMKTFDFAETLKKAGFDAVFIDEYLEKKNFSLLDRARVLKRVGFDALFIAKCLKNKDESDEKIAGTLKSIGFNLFDMNAAGFSPMLIADLFGKDKDKFEIAKELKNAGFDALFIAKYLKNKDVSDDEIAGTLKFIGFNLSDMNAAGFSPMLIANLFGKDKDKFEIAKDLKNAGFNISSIAEYLKNKGLSDDKERAQTLKSIGFNPMEIVRLFEKDLKKMEDVLRNFEFTLEGIDTSLLTGRLKDDVLISRLKESKVSLENKARALVNAGYSSDYIKKVLFIASSSKCVSPKIEIMDESAMKTQDETQYNNIVEIFQKIEFSQRKMARMLFNLGKENVKSVVNVLIEAKYPNYIIAKSMFDIGYTWEEIKKIMEECKISDDDVEKATNPLKGSFVLHNE